MTLRSMQNDEMHECDDTARVDIDLCTECGEHAGFCSVCGGSSCCGAGAHDPDGGYSHARAEEFGE